MFLLKLLPGFSYSKGVTKCSLANKRFHLQFFTIIASASYRDLVIDIIYVTLISGTYNSNWWKCKTAKKGMCKWWHNLPIKVLLPN